MHHSHHQELVARKARKRLRRVYWLSRRHVRLAKLRVSRRIAVARASAPASGSAA